MTRFAIRFTVPAALVCALALGLVPPVPAQSAGSPSQPSDRFFLSFVEDATIVRNQWWEGRLEYADYDNFEVTAITGLAAFRPYRDLEVGGRMGFGDSDVDNSNLGGRGATDLDLWAKYALDTDSGNTDFVVGGLLTVPTGDDSAGLGLDAFGLTGFGALRHRLPRWTLSAHAGVQFNGDGRIFNTPDRDGRFAPRLGAGAIYPVSEKLSVLGELVYRGERLEDFEADSRALVGINWRPAGRGVIRAAVSGGLDDGAPDFELLVGYAADF